MGQLFLGAQTKLGQEISVTVMLRFLLAFTLVAQVVSSYLVQWLLVKATGGRFFQGRWQTVHNANAQRLTRRFATLRGGFIKLGQVIAVMGGFLPEPYQRHLATLQDRVPPQPFSQIETRLRQALGPDALSRFGSFEETPIAAASLAQVHRAQLADGREVAIKILYPGIEKLIESDLKFLQRLLPLLRLLVPIVGLERVHEQLSAMLRRETDYGRERLNMETVRSIFAHRTDVVVPQVVEELCGDAVLTMSFELGESLGRPEELQAHGIDPEAVATLLTDCYLTMLFEHRRFHADPHPGNFLVRPGPVLVILDYGAVESVTEQMVEGLKTAAVGALCRNPEQVLDGAEQMGFAAPDADRQLLRRAGRKVLRSLGELQVADYDKLNPHQVRQQVAPPLSELRPLLRHIQYPEGYFYVERTLALLFGLVARLAPQRGLPGIAAPLISKVMLRGLAAKPRRAAISAQAR